MVNEVTWHNCLIESRERFLKGFFEENDFRFEEEELSK